MGATALDAGRARADRGCVFSNVFLADLYPDQRGAGVHLDITCGNVVGVDGRSKGDHKDPDRAINLCLARTGRAPEHLAGTPSAPS